jgi:ABC-type sugar transport system substrate-binding protein
MRRTRREALQLLSAVAGVTALGMRAYGADKPTIGVSFQQLTDPFFISIIYGCQRAAKEEGVKLLIHEAGGYANVDRQISQIEDFIEKKVVFLIVMPTNAKGVVPVIERAITAGIPSMHMGSRVASDKMVAFVQSDDHELGAAQGRFIAQATNGNANLLYVAGPAGVTWSRERLDGYKDAISASPGLKLLDTLWIDSSRESGLRNTEDKLQTYAGLDAIGCGADVMTQGSGDAVKAAGKVGKVRLTTAGMSKDTEDMIRDGVIQMTAAQQTVSIGYNAVKTGAKFLRKEPYDKLTKIAPVVVTGDNVRTVSLETVRAPDDFKPELTYS